MSRFSFLTSVVEAQFFLAMPQVFADHLEVSENGGYPQIIHFFGGPF